MSDLPDPIKLPDNRSDAEVIAELAREVRLRNEWVRQNRDKMKALRVRVGELEALLAALVLTYGEPVATGHRRAGVSGRTVERATGSTLSVHMDPGSGAVLIHVREG